ncbi:MAG: 50S ribosomal protein L6 [Syntrophobacteraceae bacterium CG23_combo_of_CG06-09_8_20_14_all_50_8]|nr:MAG: 50S ribosomal protein L6 [Syntrophobacteraceae bacterium CG23_combo_of_CG06-09_8_20_14_all_50_8]
MSRIGKKPIELPTGLNITQERLAVKVDGPKGALFMELPPGIEINVSDGAITVNRLSDGRKEKSYHGLVRTLLRNMVTGVITGFEKGLEISGVGYRAEVKEGIVKLLLGYSKPVEYAIPPGIDIRLDKQVNIVVSGIDKQLVGKVAAEIRNLRPPEPYKGKGIRYTSEKIRRKVGKSVGA